MNIDERLVADYSGTGLTVGKHPMFYRRAELRRANILSAAELRLCRDGDGDSVCAAGCVIARQRPGTAKGFIFISMEDETGIANVIVTPDKPADRKAGSCAGEAVGPGNSPTVARVE